MIEITYEPNSMIATAVADGRCPAVIDNLIAEHKIKGVARLRTSTVLVLDQMRLRVARGEFPYSEVVFVYGHNQRIKLNKYGMVESGSIPDICGDVRTAAITCGREARTADRRILRANADVYAEEQSLREKWFQEGLTGQ